MDQRLFVYGTLMFPEVVSLVTSITETPIDAVVYDYARYALDSREFGQVPVLVSEPGGLVAGKLYQNVSEEDFARLDHFEGVEDGEYCRVELITETVAGPLAAQAYVLSEIGHTGAEWSPTKFREESLDWYLEAICPGYRRNVIR